MGTPLYTTDIIPLTSRPTLTVMDDGDYFVILDTSTGKISKILKTNIMTALKITYDNTSGLTAETVQAALDELVINLGSTNTVIESLKGVGWTDETVKGNAEAISGHIEDKENPHEVTKTQVGLGNADDTSDANKPVSTAQQTALNLKEDKSNKVTAFQEEPTDTAYPSEKLVDTRFKVLEGTGEGSVAKAIDDALVPVQAEVDTNRLYSDQQYIELKAKAGSLQVKCNTLQAEVYTDDPILQYGAVEIIGKGYEADDTTIDVSANVVDGKLSMEQKGLTITNLVENGNFADGTTGWGFSGTPTVVSTGDGLVTLLADTRDEGIFQSFTVTTGHVYFWGFSCATTVITSGDGPYALMTGIYSSTKWFLNSNTVHGYIGTAKSNIADMYVRDYRTTGYDNFSFGRVILVDLTALGLDHITDTAILAQLLPYVDGTKNVGKMGVQILDAYDAVTQTIFLPSIGNSLPNGVADSIKTVADGWEHTQRVSTPEAVLSGVAVNTANYPTAKDGGQWVNELTAGGTEIGVIGTDSTTGAGMLRFELATPITTHYDIPLPTSGKTIHRFAGEEKIALYGTGLTFSENVLSVLSAVKFVAGVMTDITDLATITDDTVTFSGVNATDVVYVKVEHDVDRPLGILEHTPAVSNTASRLASLEARVSALEA